MGTLIGVLIVLLALCGAPLFSVFGAAALLLFARLPATPLSAVANDVFSERFADSPILVTIPLFTLAGVVLAETGASRRLVAVSRALLGWMPGGLAIVCIATSAIFTTFTGGSGITIVAVGGLLLPALLEEKYPARFSLGLVTAGGSLGLLLPPSLPIIIYGVVASVDIESLFIAAFLPGLVTLVLLSVYSGLTWRKSRVRSEPFDGRAAMAALWAAKWELLLPAALLAGLLLGVLRIHEAAAFTALYVLVISLFVYRELGVRDVPRVIRKCVTLVGAILIIMATAIGFTAYLIQANIPQVVMESMQTLISTSSRRSSWSYR
jgi:C4-dicarboxylate transporter, DctM subunit